MNNNIYNTNETMKILGEQTSWSLTVGDGIASQDYKNVMDALRDRPDMSINFFATNFFMLGFLYGQKEEKAKMKNKSILVRIIEKLKMLKR